MGPEYTTIFPGLPSIVSPLLSLNTSILRLQYCISAASTHSAERGKSVSESERQQSNHSVLGLRVGIVVFDLSSGIVDREARGLPRVVFNLAFRQRTEE
jgi:L-lactate permease